MESFTEKDLENVQQLFLPEKRQDVVLQFFTTITDIWGQT